MKRIYLLIWLVLYQACVTFGAQATATVATDNETYLKLDDGFLEVFESFVAAGQAGDGKKIAPYASKQITEDMYEPFDKYLKASWRLSKCVLRGALRYKSEANGTIVVQAIVEEVHPDQSMFVVMYWMKKNGHWVFLNFPFLASGIPPSHAFMKKSMSAVERSEE